MLGESQTRLYKIWSGIKQRCLNPKNKNFKYYGARGITVCEDWMDYRTFKEWAFDSGYDDWRTIDRVNPDMGYDPENCIWLSKEDQQRMHKRNLRLITVGIETYCVATWNKKAQRSTQWLYKLIKQYGEYEAIRRLKQRLDEIGYFKSKNLKDEEIEEKLRIAIEEEYCGL